MAQVTITHFENQTSVNVKMWKIVVEKVTAEIVYGRSNPVPGDVTVRTLKVNQEGCASDTQTELHVEIAESNWPRTKDGRDFSVEEATVHFKHLASQISEGVAKFIDQPGNFNVWVTPYRATGWSAFKVDRL